MVRLRPVAVGHGPAGRPVSVCAVAGGGGRPGRGRARAGRRGGPAGDAAAGAAWPRRRLGRSGGVGARAHGLGRRDPDRLRPGDAGAPVVVRVAGRPGAGRRPDRAPPHAGDDPPGARPARRWHPARPGDPGGHPGPARRPPAGCPGSGVRRVRDPPRSVRSRRRERGQPGRDRPGAGTAPPAGGRASAGPGAAHPPRSAAPGWPGWGAGRPRRHPGTPWRRATRCCGTSRPPPPPPARAVRGPGAPLLAAGVPGQPTRHRRRPRPDPSPGRASTWPRSGPTGDERRVRVSAPRRRAGARYEGHDPGSRTGAVP